MNDTEYRIAMSRKSSREERIAFLVDRMHVSRADATRAVDRAMAAEASTVDPRGACSARDAVRRSLRVRP